MTSKDFYDYIIEHYNKELPFVAYSLPNTFETKVILQKDDVLYKIEDYTETGFVFAPFDIRKDAILMPYSKSRTLLTTEDIVVEEETPISFKVDNDKLHHINLIKKAVTAINKKELQKVVVSRKEVLETELPLDPIKLFKTLLNSYNSAFVYCWYHPKVGMWLGATPETLLSIERNKFSTMALAGTQDYEGTLEVDWDYKEKEEQQIVSDYVVETLKNSINNMDVSEVRTVKAGKLLHLRTDITGELNHSKNMQKLILKLHPTPAVCGLPKIDAMQFVLDNEHYNREFYSGFLGELNKETKIEPRSGTRNIENRAYSFNKRSTNLFVNLRCMQLKNTKAILYVGGGITKDSIAENEWQETVNKTNTIKNVIVS
ncbi:chorismate-binding protein [Pontimicrobium aquaticum]|uniref:Isochorismate synthase n=1 Tax=Pontimicrobium aquaticum TaxID=2565367 RepID=A0A4U0EQK9_9FLAO|nr:chorismate-binding protein [Pontimicrobium aquaticum]TJY33900.1 isochorismate synthase [Pontimicrobium aquaticum]